MGDDHILQKPLSPNYLRAPRPSRGGGRYKKSIKKLLDSWFITGLTDGEGCFRINIIKDSECRTGWLIQPSFQIDLHERDLVLLLEIQRYFGGAGNIYKKPKGQLIYKVGSLVQILEKIIPRGLPASSRFSGGRSHFDTYSLITKKQADYLLFRAITVDIMQNNKHLRIEGLKEIVAMRASSRAQRGSPARTFGTAQDLNKGLSDNLKAVFPDVLSYPRPEVLNKQIPDPEWMAGFTSGEGCFFVGVKKSSTYKAGFQVVLEFSISQHIRDELLLKSFEDYFGCGKLYIYKSWVTFKCHKFADLEQKIIPFFRKHEIIGVKSEDFECRCKVADIIHNKEHLTEDGLERIRQIKGGMNKGRYTE
jgi:hypothetical protein